MDDPVGGDDDLAEAAHDHEPAVKRQSPRSPTEGGHRGAPTNHTSCTQHSAAVTACRRDGRPTPGRTPAPYVNPAGTCGGDEEALATGGRRRANVRAHFEVVVMKPRRRSPGTARGRGDREDLSALIKPKRCKNKRSPKEFPGQPGGGREPRQKQKNQAKTLEPVKKEL